jgi:ergothioneine biosynthesis protein EgtB
MTVTLAYPMPSSIASFTTQAHVALRQHYQAVRQQSLTLAQPISAEDAMIQSMPDASPTKWHLAHTTWFFETFVLKTYLADYAVFDAQFEHLFNSYYQGIGVPFRRDQRGMISRPNLSMVRAYRQYVDHAMLRLLDQPSLSSAMTNLVMLGLHHEQQHQELLLTDFKHALSIHPDCPAYRDDLAIEATELTAIDLRFIEVGGGLVTVGASAEDAFAFDNEQPQHQVFIEPFALANRTVTNAEFLAFMQADGYQTAAYWMSEGWQWVQQHHITTPMYWQQRDGQWHEHTLAGLRPLNRNAPVCHVSWFEADAYARWAGARLPTEFEWEHVAYTQPIVGNLLELDALHPPAETNATTHHTDDRFYGLFGSVWEWTRSSYAPYPRFAIAAGAVGEYNGKFMCGQFVLRGGSCATPSSHIRASYRNFFPAQTRWQFSGIRLARDVA